jgi:hypothetical protein
MLMIDLVHEKKSLGVISITRVTQRWPIALYSRLIDDPYSQFRGQ